MRRVGPGAAGTPALAHDEANMEAEVDGHDRDIAFVTLDAETGWRAAR